MKYMYTAIFTPDSGKFHARIPDLPGCISSGSTLDAAIEEITDAASLWLTTAEDEGLPISPASPQGELRLEPGELLSLIQVDTLSYRAKIDSRAVRKNVSLPAWMANLADSRGINCSQVLQEGLLERFG